MASSRPATLFPTEPADVFAVWYQAKVEAIERLPPFSAINACTAGSRSESEAPWAPRTAKSCQGTAAKT